MSPGLRRETFESWVRQHHGAVYRSALRILRDEDDAQDITQQVFLHVLQGKWKLDDVEEPERSLCWLAARQSLMHLRAARHRKRREERHAMQTPEVHEVSPSHPDDDRRVVDRCINDLPEDQRVAILLRYREGMTFAAIGGATDCSEPTAHERVKRALEALRARLSKLGYAGLLPGLPDVLRQDVPALVPQGLEGSLLAMKASVTAGVLSAVTSPIAVGILALGGLGIAASFLANPSPSEENVPSAVEASVEPGPNQEAFIARDELVRSDTGVEPTARQDRARQQMIADAGQELSGATIEGRIVDETGMALGSVEIVAESLERAGKLARYVEQTRTAEDGSYSLEVPVGVRSGQRYSIRARRQGRRIHHSEDVLVRENERKILNPIALEPSERRGAFTLAVQVNDETGAVVPGARVWLPQRREMLPWTIAAKTAAVTDANGFVELRGALLGERLMRIEAPRGLQGETLEIDLADGYSRREITLQRGFVIAGTARSIDGVIPKGLRLVAIPPAGGERRETQVDERGCFRFENLSEGDYTIARAWDQRWSPFEVRDVRSGREDLALVLKRSDDPGAEGLHKVELHGSVRDARSGEPVVLGYVVVDHVRVPEGMRREDILNTRWLELTQPFMGQIGIGPDDPPRNEHFHEVGLDTGTYMISIKQPGYAPAIAGPFTMAEGEIRGDITIDLRRGATISGKVLDPTGKPLEDAVVFTCTDSEESRKIIEERHAAVREVAGRGHLGFWPLARTDAAGAFGMKHLSTEVPLIAVALHADHEPVTLHLPRLTEGATTSVNLLLH